MEGHETLDGRLAGAVRMETDLVRGAIEMVASGGSTRVTVAGLRFGGALVAQARRQAIGRGVRVDPIWSIDEGSLVDIVVERADRRPR